MEPTTTYAVFFSPTGTSRKIARAVAQGINRAGQTTLLDLTHAHTPAAPLPSDTVAVIAAPVYGGKIAPLALERMKDIRGTNTPAVVIAVYGNRDIGGATAQLSTFVAAQGFIPIAAGAFVGEHSYSSVQAPIAVGRPDTHDLADAAAFGAAVHTKLLRGDLTAVDATRLKAPRTPLWSQLRFIRFVLGYRKRQKKNPVVLLPVTDTAACTHCGRCAALCPSNAIARGTEERTDPSRCIRCCACVKACPVEARSFDTPFGPALARNFSRRKSPVTML